MRDATKPYSGTSPKLVLALLLTAIFGGAFYLQLPESPLQVAHENKYKSSRRVSSLGRMEVPDFEAIANVEMKKRAFFDFLQPYVDAQNEKVQGQRERLLDVIGKIKNNIEPSRDDRVFIKTLGDEYEMEGEDYHDLDYLDRLLRRVDVLPPSLVLAQAANESGWGTSRFAQEAYNFFGQWCYVEGCGLVPGRRRDSSSHEVKTFNSIEEAVNAYFMNINTFPSYLDLRRIRESLRNDAKPIDGISLTEGLSSYSERGADYIDELQAMIYYNELLERDKNITQAPQD